jgi:heme-degrading monooxygenase HmoA
MKMIARIWNGRVPLEKSEEYLEKMRSVALPYYERTPGNRGAYCLYRVDGNLAHFEMLTFWDDVEAIKRFAGETYQAARYYGFDDDFLVEKEPFVLHFEVYKQ